MDDARRARSRAALLWVLTAALCHAGLTAGWAQEARGTLHGQVTDPQGAMIPRAAVLIISEDTNVKQETTTNGQGSWSVSFLNPGNYSVTVSAPGFKVAEQRGIALQTADSKQIDLLLEVGTAEERVEVTATASMIDTTSATSGTVITTEQINEMPSLSRVPTLLAGLSPGVLLKDQNQNVVNMWSYIGASAISVNGGRDDRSNEFLLDGMPNQHGDKVAFIPPTDSVSEFRIMSNNYDAQYGRQAGSTINMSIKSGTSKYAGNLYEFFRNTALNANLFQTNLVFGGARPPTHFNLYGGTMGGPASIPNVYDGKNKTFFFLSYEGNRNQDPRFTIRSVPTALERQGDFSQSFTTKTDDPTRYPVTIYDPAKVNAQTGVREPFPDNRIPQERLDPIAMKILQFVPLPNRTSDPSGNAVNNFVPNSTRNNKMASVTIRVDQNFSNNNKSFLSLRWNHEDEFSGDDFHNVSTGGYGTRINRGLGLDHVWMVGPTKVLNVRFNVTQFYEPTHDHGKGFNPVDLGFSPGLVAQMQALSFPRIDGPGLGIGGSAGGYSKFSYYNWGANLTHALGNMNLHYGGEFRILQEANFGFGDQSGQYSFGDQWTRRRFNNTDFATGTGFASFLLGLPTGGSLPRNSSRFATQRYYGVFLQNDWRVTPKLTVNMGLRWDYERPFVERYNRTASAFDPTVLNPISDPAQAAYADIMAKVLADPKTYPFGNQLAQLVPVSSFKVYGAQQFAGVNGQPRTAVHGDFHEFQPRVGFAYRLKPTTVIRGGFGRFTQAAGIKGGQNGFSRSTPMITSLDNNLTPYDTLEQPLHTGVLEPTGSSLGPLTALGQGVTWENQNPGHPYSWEYSVHVQQEYKKWLIEIGYSHNKTYNIYWGLDQNLQPFDLWQSLHTPRFDANGRPLDAGGDKAAGHAFAWDDQIPNPFKNLPGVTGSLVTANFRSIGDLLRPIKILGGITENSNPWGKNQYDALETKLERRFSKGFSIITAYTYSKLFEDTSFWGPEISGPIAEHKLGGEDRPHILSIAPIWEIPIGKGRRFWGDAPTVANALFGGWELSGTYRLQSGTPIVIGSNYFYDGQNFALPRGKRTLDRWFDTSHFKRYPGKSDDISLWPAWTGIQNYPGASYVPTADDIKNNLKNGAYNDFATVVWRQPTRWSFARNDNVNELDLGIYKNFKPTDRARLQMRCEVFNALNRPRFGNLHTSPNDNKFGQMDPVQLNQARIIQLAMKLYF